MAVAEATKDGDLGIDVRTLGDDPLIEEVIRRAGFHIVAPAGQPGSWLSASGIPVDLKVPEAIAGRGRRSVEAPPHDSRAQRRAVGLEAAIVDNAVMTIRALTPNDNRAVDARVAGPAALLVAKLRKLGERQEKAPTRLVDKDAYDVYRLLVAVPTQMLSTMLDRPLGDDLARDVAYQALDYLTKMFRAVDGVGAFMAGRAEELVGDPAVVSAASAAMGGDLLASVGR